MTIRFVDSFDHYATADLTQKYTSTSGGGNATIGSGIGRRSTNALSCNGNSAGVSKTLDSQATWIVGFSFRQITTFPASDDVFVHIMDSASAQIDIRLRSDGTVRATRNGTTLATSTNAISLATTYYMEIKVVINNTTGSVELRVNGSSTGWINISGQDTQNTANASASVIALEGAASGGTTYYDDLYICDGQGSVNNDFLGDVRIDCAFANGNGNSSQLAGSDGNSTDNYQLVDETSQNGDTDYVQSATVGQKDTYTFTDISHTPSSIFGVQINMVAKKDDSGTRSIQAVTRSGGADTDGTAQALGTSYSCYREVRETDPNTAAAWTRTNLNAAEFGVRVAA